MDLMKRSASITLAMTLFAGILGGCGNKDTSGLVYTTDFKAEDYVDLGEYKGVEIEVASPEVSDDAMKTYIKSAFSNYAEPVSGRSVEMGDITNIDYEGKLDGVAFEGGTAKGAELVIGSGRFIPGFEDGVVGMEIGQTKDIDLAFPDPYASNPDLAGKDVVFTVTVNGISAPHITDELVEGLGLTDCSTVEEYEKYVYDNLMAQAQADFEEQKMDEAVVAVEESSSFKEPPDGMVNRLNENLTNTLTSYAQMYGMELQQYISYAYGSGVENYEEFLLEQARFTAQRYIMLAAIADKEGILVTEEELEEDFAKMAERYKYESVEAYKAEIDVDAYKEFQLIQKVREFLGENAVVKSPVVSEQ